MANELELVMQQAIKHLRSGAVQLADDVLSQGLSSAQALAANPPPAEPAAPREHKQIVADLFRVISASLGNPAPIEVLLDELSHAL